MKHRRLPTLLVALALVGAACAPAAAGPAVGDKAPAFTLTDANGASRSLADYRGKIVVLEWINPNCPFSRRHAEEKTMTGTAGRHPEVVWLAVNSTNPKHGDYLKPADHLAYNAKQGIGYPVLYDSTGATGHAYGARTTPHMFVIDAAGAIAYAGAIDDDPRGRQASAERDHYVDDALAALADGRAPAPSSTEPYGCSVKY